MKTVCIIPARMGSSRFPGKPLAQICGRPMIEHVYRRCLMNKSLAGVYIATCDEEIAAATSSFGGVSIMTSSTHIRASDRVAEAARKLDADLIVMVQGDEPMLHPEMIDLAVAPFNDASVMCTNLAASIQTATEFNDPNTIKVTVDENGDALFFSRLPIPYQGNLSLSELRPLKQVCVIPFRREFLFRYTEMDPTPLEIAESIDMLRILEHGMSVRIVQTKHHTQAVDTPSDLARVEHLFKSEPSLDLALNSLNLGV